MSKAHRKLNNWIDAFMTYTNNMEPPESYRKWAAISAVASALQRKVRVEWGVALTFYPNMFIVLVGPSAAGKSMAMGAALEIINNVGTIRLAANAGSYQAIINELKTTSSNDRDEEKLKTDYHSSITIFSKEFTVFLGYKNLELMSILCDWFDCDDKWKYNTITRGSEEIFGVWVNLLGGTTPDLIRSSLPMDSIGGGLTSRIIFVYEDKPDKIVPQPMKTQAEIELQQHLIWDLEKIALLNGSFRWTKGFSDAWTDFCYESARNPPFYDSKFDGYMGRRRTHLMKLSMIMSAAKPDHPMVLTRDDFDDGLAVLKEAEEKMPLTFSGMGKSDIATLIHKAIVYLKNSPYSEIPLWKFIRHFKDDMDDWSAKRVLTTLESMKMIQHVRVPAGDNYIKMLDVNETVQKINDLNNPTEPPFSSETEP